MATKAKRVRKSDICHGKTLWQIIRVNFRIRVMRIFVLSPIQPHGPFDGEYFTARNLDSKTPSKELMLREFEGLEMFTTKKAAVRAIRKNNF